ncbi:MAG TPA: hypothetical protein ENI65_09580 [Gammaproteobacteria bacterium]|nr:hypothetical protein [Gammaproteobacteria bacterium]
MKPQQIRQGACYSNGSFGNNWTVWQVADVQPASNGDVIRYRVLVGEDRRKYKQLPRDEFASQVHYEVVLVENTWQKIE